MSKPTILIAEDDMDDRYLLEIAFQEAGSTDHLAFVGDGVELLQYLQQANANAANRYPRFILLDLNMPRKDGRQALKEIRENSRLRCIPVIVFSTTRNETEIRECYELGANTYIIKPLSFTALVDIVGKIRSYWLHTAAVPV